MLRRLRPISRWISWVRPVSLPLTDSRAMRCCEERGSMPYSAVTQPVPFPLKNGGTLSSTVAEQSRCVSPHSTRQEASANFIAPRKSRIGRRLPGSRPSTRSCAFIADTPFLPSQPAGPGIGAPHC
jgi:hypothetical protein